MRVKLRAQALHIIRKIFAGEVIAVKELRDLECGLGLHHGIGLFVHNRILLKNVPTAQAASSSVRFICRKRGGRHRHNAVPDLLQLRCPVVALNILTEAGHGIGKSIEGKIAAGDQMLQNAVASSSVMPKLEEASLTMAGELLGIQHGLRTLPHPAHYLGKPLPQRWRRGRCP